VSDCVYTYGFSEVSALTTLTFTSSPTAPEFALTSIKPGDAGTKTITMYAVTPAGTPGGTTIGSPQHTFTIIVTDPCESTTTGLTVGANPASDVAYTLH
jgi:hypothetical protein